CASFSVKPPICRESGGKLVLGVWVVPSSACTDASYSALVIRRMLGGSRGWVPIDPMQVPFMHVPLHGRLQPPQLVLLVFVSTQAFPHSICPEAAQPQLPPLQTEPPGHGLPQPPQLRAFIVVSTHPPTEP